MPVHRRGTAGGRVMLCAALLSAALLFSACTAEDAPAVFHFGMAEPTPAPTAPPTPSPTPAPPLEAAFFETDGAPMPALGAPHTQGADARLAGIVECNYPLRSVSVAITCARNEDPFYPYRAAVTFRDDADIYSYALGSADTHEGASLDALADLSLLTPGLHTLTVSLTSRGGRAEVFTTQFYVFGDTWTRIKEADFVGTYPAALRFFKNDPARFLYEYQWVWDRYILADPQWEAEHIVSLEGYGGRPWLVHRDAVPYYQEAFGYLASARVRVSGTNGDTGILPLYALIETYNGSYVSRFTSTRKKISHHAFGTASDVNAQLAPNLNTEANHAVIGDDVKQNLVYNGIATDADGAPYYDFTYAGTYACTRAGVPESILNYLLYELAFYRAGFKWGYYYESTCDAMHYTLSEDLRGSHNGADGLRKVRQYYDTAADPAQ